jgi:hypothetical protein
MWMTMHTFIYWTGSVSTGAAGVTPVSASEKNTRSVVNLGFEMKSSLAIQCLLATQRLAEGIGGNHKTGSAYVVLGQVGQDRLEFGAPLRVAARNSPAGGASRCGSFALTLSSSVRR